MTFIQSKQALQTIYTTPVAEIVVSMNGVNVKHVQSVTVLLQQVVRALNRAHGYALRDGDTVTFYISENGDVYADGELVASDRGLEGILGRAGG